MQEGSLVGGKYRLIRCIGQGAMGAVWAAQNELTKRDFAIKLIATSAVQDDDARRRMLREGEAAGQLVHPNIVQVYDVGTTDAGDPFLVMELLKGESLGDKLDRDGALSIFEAATIGAAMARALEAAHAARIVHRDIKPDNVFLHREGRTLSVKVLDFGVSKLLSGAEATSTVTGAVIGTPAYMSPEQARGDKDVDGRADLWALGVVLYEMLTGTRPFEGESAYVVVAAVLSAPVPDLHSSGIELPAELIAIVERCLTRDRGKRRTSAGEVADVLEHLGDTPSRRRRPTAKQPRESLETAATMASAGSDGAAQPASTARTVVGDAVVARERGAEGAAPPGARPVRLPSSTSTSAIVTPRGGGGTAPGPASPGRRMAIIAGGVVLATILAVVVARPSGEGASNGTAPASSPPTQMTTTTAVATIPATIGPSVTPAPSAMAVEPASTPVLAISDLPNAPTARRAPALRSSSPAPVSSPPPTTPTATPTTTTKAPVVKFKDPG